MQQQLHSRLARDRDNAMIGGVCAGIARSYGFDVTLIRVITVLLTMGSLGLGLVLYGALLILMPEEAPVSAESPVMPGMADPAIPDMPDTPEPPPTAQAPIDDLSRRARRAADDLTTAARSAAGAARVAADQLAVAARAATVAGREAWEQQRATGASARHQGAPLPPSAHAPEPPVVTSPPHEVTGAPGPDDAHAEEAPKPGV